MLVEGPAGLQFYGHTVVAGIGDLERKRPIGGGIPGGPSQFIVVIRDRLHKNPAQRLSVVTSHVPFGPVRALVGRNSDFDLGHASQAHPNESGVFSGVGNSVVGMPDMTPIG